MPDKLAELQRLWLIEATKYNVLPLDDRTVERFNPELAGRPEYVKGTKQTLYPGMTRLTESSLLNIKNKSFQVTAQVVVPDCGAQGTIIAQGGSYGGWGLMVHEGAARFAYNLLGVNVFITDAERPVPAGEHQVRAEFAYDGGGLAKGGTVTLYYDGEKAGEGKIGLTQPMLFTATETAEVGCELGTPVIPDTPPKDTKFTGEIKWVELATGDDDHTHMLDPDDIMQTLMAKQ